MALGMTRPNFSDIVCQNTTVIEENLIQSPSTSIPPSIFFEDFLPSKWHKKDTYVDKTHTYFHLHPESKEYKTIKDEFQNSCKCSRLKIKKIERIQHPFAYFGFFIRRQQIRELCRCEPQVERIFIPLKRNLFNDELISYNGDFRRIKENSGTKKGYVVVVMKVLIDYQCYSYPIIYEEVRDNEKYPEYLITLDKDLVNVTEGNEIIDLENYNFDSCDRLDSNCVCISKNLEEFCELFDAFPETRGDLLLSSYKYPVPHYLNHGGSNCKCTKCIASFFPNRDPKMPLPFISTEKSLKFWNTVLNY